MARHHETTCTERGYHEFCNTMQYERLITGEPEQVRYMQCTDCKLKASDYLKWGWVHPNG